MNLATAFTTSPEEDVVLLLAAAPGIATLTGLIVIDPHTHLLPLLVLTI